MAAALRAAEGGYIFSKSSGGVFSKFSGQGGIPPTPHYSRPLVMTDDQSIARCFQIQALSAGLPNRGGIGKYPTLIPPLKI